MVSLDRIREYVAVRRPNRRLIAVILLLLVMLFGLGIGTISEETDGDYPGLIPDDDPDTPPDVEIETPTQTPTPTPTPGGGASETPAPGDGSTQSSGDGLSADSSSETAPDSSSSSTDTPTATATATATATPTDDGYEAESSSDGGDGYEDGSDSVELQIENDTLRIRAAGVVPGDEISESVVVQNNGSSAALPGAVVRNVTDSENGRTEPEAAVDNTPNEGELSSVVQVRLSVDRPDDSRAYLIGNATDHVPLQDIEGEPATGNRTLEGDDEATLRLDLLVPKDAGNEIQTDGVTFDVGVFLRVAS